MNLRVQLTEIAANKIELYETSREKMKQMIIDRRDSLLQSDINKIEMKVS